MKNGFWTVIENTIFTVQMVEFKLTCMCLKYDSDCPICFKNRITDLEKLEMNAAFTHVLLYGLAFWPFGDKLGEYICDYKKLGLNYLAHEFIYYYRHGIKHLVGDNIIRE